MKKTKIARGRSRFYAVILHLAVTLFASHAPAVHAVDNGTPNGGACDIWTTHPAFAAEVEAASTRPQDFARLTRNLYMAMRNGERRFSSTELQFFESAAIPMLKSYFPSDLSMIITLFWKSDYRPSPRFMTAWENSVLLRMVSFNHRDLRDTLYPLGQWRTAISPALSSAWQNQAVKEMGTFEPRDLANTLFAMTNAHMQPTEAFLAAWQVRAASTAALFNARDLALAIYAFSQLKAKPSDLFLNAWVTAAQAQLESFNAIDLSNSMYAFSHMRIRPPAAFNAKWQAACVKSLARFDSQSVANALYAMAVLAIEPTAEFTSTWLQVFTGLAQARKLVPQDVSNSVFSFYLLKNPQACRVLLAAIPKELWSKTISREDEVIQLVLPYLYFKTVMKIDIAQLALRPLDSLRFESSDRRSHLEEQVAADLTARGANFQAEYRTRPGFIVDFFISRFNLIVQADGPFHYIRDLGGDEFQRPQDLRMDEILRTFGYTIQRIKYTTMDEPSAN